MSWLDVLHRRAAEAREKIEPMPRSAAPAPRESSEPLKIEQTYFQTRRPTESDPGAIEIVFYSVSNGVLTLRDKDGKPTGERCRLGGGDPRDVARRLGRDAWLSNLGEADFNRPLHFPPLSIA